MRKMVKGKNIILGITGSIAAYKAADLISKLKLKGANIDVIMTKNACEFITPLTLQTLCCNKVNIDMFSTESKLEHIALAEKADLIVVAPATANFIGKIRAGIADDLLTTVIIASLSKILIAPAMNENMYKNNIVRENIQYLQKTGYIFIEPEIGKLACGKIGEGRLANIDKIVDKIEEILK